MPAKVAGTWSTPQGELTLKQEFQEVGGSLKSGGLVTNGKLRGDQITFNIGNTRYQGKVNGRTIEGTATTGGQSQKWTATRT